MIPFYTFVDQCSFLRGQARLQQSNGNYWLYLSSIGVGYVTYGRKGLSVADRACSRSGDLYLMSPAYRLTDYTAAHVKLADRSTGTSLTRCTANYPLFG